MHSHSYPRIWDAVSRIPRGKVSTYGEIAKIAGFPRQARLVGYAMHNVPSGADIPWHRVINSQGRISLPKARGHYDRQRALLEKEGVVFVRDKVELKKYAWKARGVRRTRCDE